MAFRMESSRIELLERLVAEMWQNVSEICSEAGCESRIQNPESRTENPENLYAAESGYLRCCKWFDSKRVGGHDGRRWNVQRA